MRLPFGWWAAAGQDNGSLKWICVSNARPQEIEPRHSQLAEPSNPRILGRQAPTHWLGKATPHLSRQAGVPGPAVGTCQLAAHRLPHGRGPRTPLHCRLLPAHRGLVRSPGTAQDRMHDRLHSGHVGIMRQPMNSSGPHVTVPNSATSL